MSRTKGCISLLLVLCLMLGHLSPITLAIENHVVEGEMAAESPMDLSILSDQVMTGSCGEALTWTLSDDGVLTISGTGEMTDYTDGMPAPWNDHWHQLESVVIGDGVTSIGDQAFSGLSFLMDVEIGDDVEVIGYKAFYNCNLLNLQLGKRLRVIEDCAFQNAGLFDLRLPDSVTSIGDFAFAECRNLHSLDIYRSDVTIGEGAFSSCERLVTLSLGMGRVTIGDRAFSGCTGITEIFFGENVIEIGSFAFENCDSIQRIHFSGAAPNFGEQVFKNVTAVVIYPKNDDSWTGCISQEYGGNLTWLVYVNCWEEGHVYEAVVTEPTCEEEGFTTYTCFYCGDYYTDDYIQSLGHNFVDGVCTNCSLVLEIVAEGQTDLGLVWKLDNLGILTISGSGYMYGFSKAEQAPWYAYKNKIRTLVIENGVLSIGYNAFYHYIYLEKVKIASSVGSIGSQAFYSCRYLRDIVFEGSPPAIEWNSFYDVKASATYPSDGGWTNDNLQDYGGKITWVEKQICDPAEHAYEAVVTEPSCAKIGYTTHICTICDRSYVEAYTNALGHRFENGECTTCGITESIVAEGACGENLVWKLTDDGLLDISGTGEMTGAHWETYKDRITCAVIHDGVTSVAAKAFNNCAALLSVAIPDSVTEFYASFKGCTNLRVVMIPDSVTVCSPYFEDCINLEYVEIPNGMTKIGSWMFGGCKKLKSIDIPDTVTVIQNNAFHGCISLQEICIPEGVHTIEEQAFFCCNKAERIIIPNTVTTIGKYAFGWNGKVSEIHIPASVTNIGEEAFRGYENLRKVVIAGDEVTLDEGIFMECTALEEIRFEGVRPVFLSYDVFGDCDATVYFHGRDCIWQEMIKHDSGEATFTWVNLDDELAEHVLEKYEYKEPTCTESGYEAYAVCTVCEQIIPGYVELPAYGHNYEHVYTEPTCTEDGGMIWICNRCGDSWFQPERPALGHNYEAVVTDPTCTEGGYTTYTCSTCGFTRVADQTAALGHSYESVVTKEPALLENGEMTNTCTVCGYSYTEVIPAMLKHEVYEDHVEITKYTGNDTELVIPAEIEGLPVTSINFWAFRDCTGLTSITIPDSVTSIGVFAFSGCSSLTSISIPDGVRVILPYTFSRCSSLTSVDFGDNLFTISNYAFSGCSNLTSISIPHSVSRIGDYAFSNCTSLTDIFFDGDAPDFGVDVFYGVVATAYYPTGVPGWTLDVRQNHGGTITWVANGEIDVPQTHEFTAVITAPTCTEGGYTTYTCVVCGYSYVGNETEPRHNYEYVVNEDGKQIYVCTACGDSCTEVMFADYRYVVYKDHVEITEYIGNDSELVIPNEIEGLPVTAIGDDAFSYCTSLLSVDIPEGVTSIGADAFYSCTNLTSIDIPDGVTAIGDRAFQACNMLTSISVPDSVTAIGHHAFMYCRSLTSIDLSDRVSVIGDSTFSGCTSLTSIDLPDSVTSIGWRAFEQCYGLTRIDIPDSLTSIAREAFQYCTSLTSVDFPDGLTDIGDSAFSGCTSLTSIDIPDSITFIGNNAFEDCDSLAAINVDANNPNYSSDDQGVLFNKTKTELIQAPSAITGSYVIPNSVVSIGPEAFAGCTSLTSVDIPDGVTSIGNHMFSGCTSLTSIRIPDSVTSIGHSVFYNCHSLTSIDLPDGVTAIGSVVFYYCTSLTSADLPDALTSIGVQAFYNCTSLTSIDLPVGVTSIGGSAFAYCSSLASINIPDSVTSIGNAAFAGCASLTSINVPGSVASIGDSAFASCASLTSIDILDGVTSIGNSAFAGCASLTNIDLPNSVISIGNSAFANCASLTNINLPNRLSSIGDRAFAYCASLARIDIPGRVRSIGSYAFSFCDSLTIIYFNGDVPAFGENVFANAFRDVTATAYYPSGNPTWTKDVLLDYGGTIIWETFEKSFDYVVHEDHVEVTNYNGDDTMVVIPSEIEGLPVTVIGSNTFAQCGSLTSIEIADSVTSIGDGAFNECISLTSIYFNGDAPVFDGETFRGVDASVYYPEGNTTWTEAVMQDYGGNITWVNHTPCPHEYNAVVTAPTCTESGYTTYTCGICGISYVVYEVKPLAHDYVTDVAKEVTATEDGEVVYTCTTCGYSYTEIIPAYLQWVVRADHVEITGHVGKPTEVVIPSEIGGLPVTIIGDFAFYNCDVMTAVSIPDSVTVIGDSAFQDCSRLISIAIPDSVTSIGVYAFQFCDRMNSVSLPKGITKIADHTFEHCWDLRSISIPDSVTSIGDYAFCGSGLYSITIPRNVTYIGKGAFEMCFAMLTIDFEEGVTDSGDGALAKCEELTSVRFKGDAPMFGQNFFEEVTATAYYPAGNPTWTADVRQDYGGTITWVSYGNEKMPFTDVTEGSFFAEPVMWAVENGITNGTSVTTFGPNDQCMRAHVVTFLWRAVGCPEPTRTDNPFVDVKPTDFYYKPVLWALENGITSGMDATHFGPTSYCNRAQVVTFLYRTLGSPVVESTSNPFTDVPAGQWYTAPVLWAVKNGITNGLSATSFGPNSICNRAQIVTFLYRAFVND